MTIDFYKTSERNGSSYVRFRLRSLANLSNENDDRYCFIWFILSDLQPIVE